MSMCRVFSCIVGRGCLLWPVHSLGRTLLASALVHSVLQGQFFLILQVFLDFLILYSSPLSWKGHLVWGFLEGLAGLHRTVPRQLLQYYWSVHRLDYCDTEWYALEMNRDHSVIFEIGSKYCISNFCVDYDCYSISSKGFLPIIVDIMVIWVKFTHSGPF